MPLPSPVRTPLECGVLRVWGLVQSHQLPAPIPDEPGRATGREAAEPHSRRQASGLRPRGPALWRDGSGSPEERLQHSGGRGARRRRGRGSLHLSESLRTQGRGQGRVAAGPCAVLHGSPQPATVSRGAGPCLCISEKAIPMAERVDSRLPWASHSASSCAKRGVFLPPPPAHGG